MQKYSQELEEYVYLYIHIYTCGQQHFHKMDTSIATLSSSIMPLIL